MKSIRIFQKLLVASILIFGAMGLSGCGAALVAAGLNSPDPYGPSQGYGDYTTKAGPTDQIGVLPPANPDSTSGGGSGTTTTPLPPPAIPALTVGVVSVSGIGSTTAVFSAEWQNATTATAHTFEWGLSLDGFTHFIAARLEPDGVWRAHPDDLPPSSDIWVRAVGQNHGDLPVYGPSVIFATLLPVPPPSVRTFDDVVADIKAAGAKTQEFIDAVNRLRRTEGLARLRRNELDGYQEKLEQLFNELQTISGRPSGRNYSLESALSDQRERLVSIGYLRESLKQAEKNECRSRINRAGNDALTMLRKQTKAGGKVNYPQQVLDLFVANATKAKKATRQSAVEQPSGPIQLPTIPVNPLEIVIGAAEANLSATKSGLDDWRNFPGYYYASQSRPVVEFFTAYVTYTLFLMESGETLGANSDQLRRIANLKEKMNDLNVDVLFFEDQNELHILVDIERFCLVSWAFEVGPPALPVDMKSLLPPPAPKRKS